MKRLYKLTLWLLACVGLWFICIFILFLLVPNIVDRLAMLCALIASVATVGLLVGGAEDG